MKYRHGVVIGKFCPPHRGHGLLITTATSESARVTVIVCAKPGDIIPGERRGSWLRELHPDVEVLVIDDRYDENDSRVWAENTVKWLGHAPDAVFTSEDYGDRYAHHLGCVHVLVDKPRRQIACSGTVIRDDPYDNWDFIDPPVRAWFAKRICVLGAESTGTTTLAMSLAKHYSTPWVAEYGREYSLSKRARGKTDWVTEEFSAIASEQCRREDEAARMANRLLICDTNAFATTIWHRRYMGVNSDAVAEIARGRKCDLYLLTGDDVPFVQDGLRDGEHLRHEMHQWFVDALDLQTTPVVVLTGSHDDRKARAVEEINKLFVGSAWFHALSRRGVV